METRLSDVMRRVAAEQNVLRVDAAKRLSGHTSYFVEFVHFTDEGAAALARTIANEIACLHVAEPTCLAREETG